jgi:hypothetical protein
MENMEFLKGMVAKMKEEFLAKAEADRGERKAERKDD